MQSYGQMLVQVMPLGPYCGTVANALLPVPALRKLAAELMSDVLLSRRWQGRRHRRERQVPPAAPRCRKPAEALLDGEDMLPHRQELQTKLWTFQFRAVMQMPHGLDHCKDSCALLIFIYHEASDDFLACLEGT